MAAADAGPVAFLFLGETLLIPHLFPIVEALAELAPTLTIDLWVATSMHEALLRRWTQPLAERIRIRRAPGFRLVAGKDGQRPALPAKLPMLARLAPQLARVPVAVCAEQTSLWLPTLLPLRTRFVKTSHGVGSMSARDDRRRRSAFRTLVPSERERATYLVRGMPADSIVATGYVKSAFRQRTDAQHLFPTSKPIILYTPHWQEPRSSWWRWGAAIVDRLTRQDRYNVILAPHQRLVERAPDVHQVLASVAHLPHVHCDLDSFAMVDGSYTAAADLYLGDTSSQFVEFAARPRPAVFLNAHGAEWQADPSYAMWACGEVVTRLDDALPAIARATALHGQYRQVQADYASSSLGDTSGAAARRAAEEILSVLSSPTKSRSAAASARISA